MYFSNQSLKALYTPVVSLILAISITLVAQYKYDDGWATLTIDNYLKTSRFSYVIYYNDIEYTFQKSWFWLISIFRSQTDNIFALRIPALFFSCVSCVALWGTVRLAFNNKPPFLAVFFGWYSVYFFLITLRAEPVLVAAVSTVLYCTTIAFVKKQIWAMAYVPPVIAIAIASHPIGIVSLFLYLYYCFILLRLKRFKITVTVFLVYISSIAFSLLLAIKATLWNLSISEFLRLLSIVANESTHNQGISAESMRYRYFYDRNSTYAITLWATCVATILPGLKSVIHNRSLRITDPRARYFSLLITIPVLFYLLFLTVYPAKWEHYFALLCPFLFITLCYLILYIDIFTRFSKSLTHLIVVGYCVYLASYQALYSVLGRTQYSYLKSWLFNKTISLDFISNIKPNESIYMVPYLYPYFKLNKQNFAPLDLYAVAPNFIVDEFQGVKYLKGKFNLGARTENLGTFYFEDKELYIYSVAVD